MGENTNCGQRDSAVKRRSILTGGASLGAAALSGCLGGTFGSSGGDGTTSGPGSGDRTKVKTMNLEGSMFVPVFFYGREQNIWADRGIDLSMEVAGFGKFTRTFSQNLATGVSPLSSLPMASNLAGDPPVKCFGQTMNFINQCFVPGDSDIQEPSDLEGKVLGVPGRVPRRPATTSRSGRNCTTSTC